jgi:hypothetical protein
MPHQLFVRNFLSFSTPYNSLLLYHGLGSGKTCSAIGIAEEMRAYMKQMGITKRIIIVASPNVQDNFRLQLFDERRLEQLPDGTWNLNTCIGNSLLQEINPTNLQGMTRERIVSQIKSIIHNYYVFMGNKGEFANYIKKVSSVPEDSGLSKAEIEEVRKKKIKAYFNNRLVILDEIHNVRISDANKTKMTATLLNEIAKKSDNMRLLLMSATPMYNSHTEIIWLVNLLNANDKRGLIKTEDVFSADGSFVEEKTDAAGKVIQEGGKSLLTRKLTGYVSYVRGENPYIFPYRVYPNTYAPENTLIPSQYPSVQMNQQPITDPLKYIPVYMNTIGEYQSKGYSTYRCHIFPMTYDEQLPFYYNNNQRFLQKRLDPAVIRDTKIFEKTQIQWFDIDDLAKRRHEFRDFYRNIIDLILDKKAEIIAFTKKSSLLDWLMPPPLKFKSPLRGSVKLPSVPNVHCAILPALSLVLIRMLPVLASLTYKSSLPKNNSVEYKLPLVK